MKGVLYFYAMFGSQKNQRENERRRKQRGKLKEKKKMKKNIKLIKVNKLFLYVTLNLFHLF